MPRKHAPGFVGGGTMRAGATGRPAGFYYPTNIDEVTSQELATALARVLGSAAFVAAPKNGDFLNYVVEAAILGKRIKGYTIGIEALGLNQNFDLESRSIVRVRAIRVRRALDLYYAHEGLKDPIIIEIPRGRYSPAFHRRPIADATNESPPAPTTYLERGRAYIREAARRLTQKSRDK